MIRSTDDPRKLAPGFVPRLATDDRTTRRTGLWVGGYASFVGLLTLLHGLHFDAQFTTEIAIVLVLAAATAAWWCPLVPVVTVVLVCGIVWCVLDLNQMGHWWRCIAGYTVRIASTLLSVFFVSHVRRQLLLARYFARIDGLTGLPNRQAILEALDAEICRVRRFGRSLSLAMLDCDDFKQINDHYGHLEGDRVLRCIADALRKSTRAYDYVGRLSGDEFVMIISEINPVDIPVVIERMRAVLRQELRSDPTSPTFSIGVATIRFHGIPHHATIDRLECLRLADKAMYAAKAAGRDQTIFETIDWPIERTGEG